MFRVEGLGFGLGCRVGGVRVQGLRVGAQGSGSRVKGWGYKV